MGRFSQWIAGLLERDFYGRRDLYEPDEALERVAAYMEPGDADAAAQYAASLGSKE